jgi:hypothetical protein
MYTLEPLTAKVVAIIRPIPVPPPVTSTTLPSTENSEVKASEDLDFVMV